MILYVLVNRVIFLLMKYDVLCIIFVLFILCVCKYLGGILYVWLNKVFCFNRF